MDKITLALVAKAEQKRIFLKGCLQEIDVHDIFIIVLSSSFRVKNIAT